MVDSKWKELWSNLPLFGKYALGGIGVLGALMILRDEDSTLMKLIVQYVVDPML